MTAQALHENVARKPQLPCARTVSLAAAIAAMLAPFSASWAAAYKIEPIDPGYGPSLHLVTGINDTGQVTASFEMPVGTVAYAVRYSSGTIDSVGALGGTYSWARAINASGQVVGWAQINKNMAWHAFLYSDGKTTDLGTLGGADSWARAINASGQIVGQAGTISGSIHAFLYSNGAMIDLGTLGGIESKAAAINDLGQVVGEADPPGYGGPHPFLHSDGKMIDLGTLGGTYGWASAINAAGQVVGVAQTSNNGGLHAFLYSQGAMRDLGTLGGKQSFASAINATGQVVGEADTPTNHYPHAFLYSNGTLTDLGTLGGTYSTALAINDAGQVVGGSTTANDGGSHAFLYANGQLYDLNDLLPADSGWALYDAWLINGNGQIAGRGSFRGQWLPFLMTPNRPQAVASTTEPGPFDESATVTLDGTASTAPGCTRPNASSPCPTYQWTQVSGPGVTLSSATDAQPSFTAPNVLPKWSDTLTFKLVVNDGLFTSEPALVNVTVNHLNQKPVADAGTAQAVKEGAPVTLTGAASYDPEGAPLSYGWSNVSTDPACANATATTPGITLTGANTATPSFTAPVVGSAGGLCKFSLTVSDDKGLASTPASVSVTVENVNHAPMANAGPDQTVNAKDAVTLDAGKSSDPDKDPLNYYWTQLSGKSVTLTAPTLAIQRFTAPSVPAGGDTLVFQVDVDDGLASSSDQVSVKVLNPSDPPACERAKASPKRLWAPDHKLKEVEIEELGEDKKAEATGVNEKDHDDVFVKILGVTQDEPTSGLDGADASPDAVVMNRGKRDKLLLRAERAKGGNGRVYAVTYRAKDKQGSSCQGVVKVCVPSQARRETCTDDGQQYDSTVK